MLASCCCRLVNVLQLIPISVIVKHFKQFGNVTAEVKKCVSALVQFIVFLCNLQFALNVYCINKNANLDKCFLHDII